MKVEQHDIDVNDLSHGDLILRTRDFARYCEEHRAFKEGAPPCVPGPAHYRELADSLTSAVQGGAGDTQKEAEAQAIRERIVRSMTFTAQFIVMFSDHHNDPGLLKIGFEMKTRPPYKKVARTVLPPRPSKFTVTDDKEPGTIYVTVGNRPRNGSVEVQVTDGSPADEASFWRLGNFYECRFKAKGLQSVKKYHVRCRFDTPAGPGPWSEIIAVVVS